MPDFIQFVSALREQMHATLSRSDVLRPVAWLVLLLLTLMIGTLTASGPTWLLIVIAVLLSGTVLLYGGAYVYCLLNDRDALRSERYSLQKMAIEHGLLGDNSTGLSEPGPEQRRFGAPDAITSAEPES